MTKLYPHPSWNLSEIWKGLKPCLFKESKNVPSPRIPPPQSFSSSSPSCTPSRSSFLDWWSPSESEQRNQYQSDVRAKTQHFFKELKFVECCDYFWNNWWLVHQNNLRFLAEATLWVTQGENSVSDFPEVNRLTFLTGCSTKRSIRLTFLTKRSVVFAP